MARPIAPDRTGSARAARAADALRGDARRRARRPPSACARPARAARAATARCVIDAAAEDAVFARARARCTPTGARFTAVSEERGDGRLRRRRDVLRRHRPDRRLAERQARAAAPRALDRRRRRRRRWPTSCSATCYDFGAGRGVGRAARRGRAAQRRAARPGAAASAATRDGRLELLGDRVRRPALGRATSADALAETAPPRCARSARSRSRCARSPPRGSTGWSRCSAAARSTPPPRS